jgi:hypothetical protein
MVAEKFGSERFAPDGVPSYVVKHGKSCVKCCGTTVKSCEGQVSSASTGQHYNNYRPTGGLFKVLTSLTQLRCFIFIRKTLTDRPQ